MTTLTYPKVTATYDGHFASKLKSLIYDNFSIREMQDLKFPVREGGYELRYTNMKGGKVGRCIMAVDLAVANKRLQELTDYILSKKPELALRLTSE